MDDSSLIGLIGGLAGVMLGAFLTNYSARKTAVSGRMHESRIRSYNLFASAAMEYRRAIMDRWFQEQRPQGGAESMHVYTTRSAAWTALYGVQLVSREQVLGDRASEVLQSISKLKSVKTRDEISRGAEGVETMINSFVSLARKEIAAKSKVL